MQKRCKINPDGDNPRRSPHRSYMDHFGFNPMKASMDSCFIRSRLGKDPITGLPLTIFDEQRYREMQILESLGELVILYRQLIIPDQEIENRRCPLCWDEIRKQARSSCPLCNGYGIISNDPDAIQGFQWFKNPDREDGMFYISDNFVANRFNNTDAGLTVNHDLSFWTVPVKNCEGNFVDIMAERDIMIRYIFNQITKRPIQELGRYEITNVSHSLVQDNYLMHMTFDAKKLDPGIKQREYSLPNRLDLMS